MARSWRCCGASMFPNNAPPPPPPEIAGMELNVEYVSMLALSQNAAQAGSIERVLQIVGQIASIDPAVTDNLDFDMALDIYSNLLNNSPRMNRSPTSLMAIRQQRQQQQAAQQQAEMAEKYAGAAQAASQIDVGAGQNL